MEVERDRIDIPPEIRASRTQIAVYSVRDIIIMLEFN